MKVEEHIVHVDSRKSVQGDLVEKNHSAFPTPGCNARVGDIHTRRMHSECNGGPELCERKMASSKLMVPSVSEEKIDRDPRSPSKRSALRRHCEFWDTNKVSLSKNHT